MGYNGFVQRWCPDGHYWTTPDRGLSQQPDKDLKQDSVCPVCEKSHAAYNEVDNTNCDSFGFIDITNRLPSYKEICTGEWHFWHQDMQTDPIWISAVADWDRKEQRAGWRWLETGF